MQLFIYLFTCLFVLVLFFMGCVFSLKKKKWRVFDYVLFVVSCVRVFHECTYVGNVIEKMSVIFLLIFLF